MTEQTEGAEVAELADGFLASHLSWGTHADRWNDADWQRRFWTEVARTFLASGWYADAIAAAEARGAQAVLAAVEAIHVRDEDWPSSPVCSICAEWDAMGDHEPPPLVGWPCPTLTAARAAAAAAGGGA